MKRLTCPFVFTLLGVFLLITGAGLTLFGVRRINAANIIEMVVLKNNSNTFNRWIRPNKMVSFKIFIFNITNPKEIIDGCRPQLKSVGPYVYEQKTEKTDLLNFKNFLVYRLNNTFRFDEKSSGRWAESDQVIIANVPLIGVHLLKNRCNSMMTNFSDGLFLRASVKELLFDGVQVDCSIVDADPITRCLNLDEWPSPLLRKIEDKLRFSFFHRRDGVEPETYTVDLGIKDVKNTGQVIAINGSSFLNLEEGIVKFNTVKGSDGTQFPVPLTEKLYFYDKNFCRFVPVEFHKIIRYRGIRLYRYVTMENFIKNKVGSICNKLQKTDISNCPTTGSSLVASFPNFHSNKTQKTIIFEILNSSKQHHRTVLDIEPNFGVTIIRCKRFQFNLDVRKVRNFYGDKKNESDLSSLFPILWTEEKFTVTDDFYKQIRYGILGKQILEILWMGSIILGMFLALASYPLWFSFEKIKHSSSKVFYRSKAKVFAESQPEKKI